MLLHRVKNTTYHHGAIAITVQDRIPESSLSGLPSREAGELAVHPVQNLSTGSNAAGDPSQTESEDHTRHNSKG